MEDYMWNGFGYEVGVKDAKEDGQKKIWEDRSSWTSKAGSDI